MCGQGGLKLEINIPLHATNFAKWKGGGACNRRGHNFRVSTVAYIQGWGGGGRQPPAYSTFLLLE